MRLSTRGQYGVKAMFDFALRYGDGPITIKTVAESQDISEHYLEQLMSALKKAGLVESVRGAQGGYMLARTPDEISIGDIIRVLEGPITLVDCAPEHGIPECVKADRCVTRGIWQKMGESIANVVDSITLGDLVEDAKKNNSYMFYI